MIIVSVSVAILWYYVNNQRYVSTSLFQSKFIYIWYFFYFSVDHICFIHFIFVIFLDLWISSDTSHSYLSKADYFQFHFLLIYYLDV